MALDYIIIHFSCVLIVLKFIIFYYCYFDRTRLEGRGATSSTSNAKVAFTTYRFNIKKYVDKLIAKGKKKIKWQVLYTNIIPVKTIGTV